MMTVPRPPTALGGGILTNGLMLANGPRRPVIILDRRRRAGRRDRTRYAWRRATSGLRRASALVGVMPATRRGQDDRDHQPRGQFADVHDSVLPLGEHDRSRPTPEAAEANIPAADSQRPPMAVPLLHGRSNFNCDQRHILHSVRTNDARAQGSTGHGDCAGRVGFVDGDDGGSAEKFPATIMLSRVPSHAFQSRARSKRERGSAFQEPRPP